MTDKIDTSAAVEMAATLRNWNKFMAYRHAAADMIDTLAAERDTLRAEVDRLRRAMTKTRNDALSEAANACWAQVKRRNSDVLRADSEMQRARWTAGSIQAETCAHAIENLAALKGGDA